jgi:microcystin-dependent protein
MQPFLSEVRLFSFNFAPQGFAACNGAILAIQQNEALFSLLGTTFGGNGITTFALPDLRARVPLGFGSNLGIPYTMGQVGGEASHSLTPNEIPAHLHSLNANSSALPSSNTNTPSGTTSLGRSVGHPSSGSDFAVNLYSSVTGSNLATAAPQAVGQAGSGAPHENRQPYLGINYCMALQGFFPSRN